MIATQFLGVFIPSFIVLIDSQVCPRNNTWECSDGGCIWSDRRCDDNPHCRDRSDEKNCANWTCSPNWWKCGTDLCIWHRDRCDGRMDCADGSDERNCENWSCGKFRWKCGDGTLCIGQHLRCDGRTQCSDGSDEQNCENWLCGDDQWKCGDGTLCIRLSLQCDGRTQCADGSDEQHCDTAAVKSLTLDGHNDTITVDGDGHRTLNLTCRVFGRVKGLVKIKKESDVFGNVHFPFYKLHYQTLGTFTFDVVMTLSDVTCNDMGRYTCAVGQDSKSIQLNVSCEGMKYGGNLTCPSAWKIGQNVKLTLTLDRSIWPSICRTDPDRREAWFEVIRWNDTGRQSIMCTVVNITLPGACQGAFTPGTIGCGCVSKTKWHFTLELNFVMDLSYFGNWSVDTHCLRTDFSKPIQFNVTPECNVRLTCEDKTYGARCDEPCGHCADDQTCNASTGQCPACQDGWLPPLCTQGTQT
ncbi:low-density lipoprotein receptor-related protein-like [Littorina saxatilis]|uniref:low-density lipoprotein receptor-related protein-like n=1 Tax=Littorina saxatilis TaxID=31220 RepID=UPI0038B5BB18